MHRLLQVERSSFSGSGGNFLQRSGCPFVLSGCPFVLVGAVVWGFLGDLDIMHVRFTHAGGGDFNKLRFLA